MTATTAHRGSPGTSAPASVDAAPAYRESEAKSAQNPESAGGIADSYLKKGVCGSHMVLAKCSVEATIFGKRLRCGREWCDTCGADDSSVHGSRVARQLGSASRPRAFQMDDIGYLVIEAPREWRMKSCWHSRFGLENVRAAIVNALAGRRMGGRGRSRRHGVFDRCLNMRLHYFGDKNPGKWNPHFNLLVDSVSQEFRDKLSHEIDEHDIKMRRLVKVGARKEVKYAIAQLGMIAVWRRGGMALPAPALQAMKTAIRSAVGIDNLIINYSHSDEPGRKFHWISYIERSTFRKLDWDEYMAAQLCGFRNARRWGKWDSPAVWSLNDLQGEDKAKAESLVKVATLAEGTCPDCHAPLESRINADGQLVFWSTPVLSDYLAVWPHEDIGAEFYRIPSRECPDHVLKNNDMDFRKRRAIVRGRYVEYVGERTRTMVALKYLVGSRRDVSCEAEYNLAMLQLVTDAAGRKEISCQLALLPEFDPVNVFRGSMIKAFCQDNLDDG